VAFSISRQKGSHVNLVRIISDKKQTVTIPNHTELDRGTLNSIYKKLKQYIDESDLREYFFV
jgi:predicted RNA binding protein YcfA (HicA-like mRNA interferase family)